jgi:hypothetical protein
MTGWQLGTRGNWPNPGSLPRPARTHPVSRRPFAGACSPRRLVTCDIGRYGALSGARCSCWSGWSPRSVCTNLFRPQQSNFFWLHPTAYQDHLAPPVACWFFSSVRSWPGAAGAKRNSPSGANSGSSKHRSESNRRDLAYKIDRRSSRVVRGGPATALDQERGTADRPRRTSTNSGERRSDRVQLRRRLRRSAYPAVRERRTLSTSGGDRPADAVAVLGHLAARPSLDWPAAIASTGQQRTLADASGRASVIPRRTEGSSSNKTAIETGSRLHRSDCRLRRATWVSEREGR